MITPAELWTVAAFRKFDDNRIVLALRLVVFLQLRAKPGCFCADNRVRSWIKTGASIENFDTEDIFLEQVGLSFKSLRDHELQEPAMTRRLNKRAAAQNFLEFDVNEVDLVRRERDGELQIFSCGRLGANVVLHTGLSVRNLWKCTLIQRVKGD